MIAHLFSVVILHSPWDAYTQTAVKKGVCTVLNCERGRDIK